MEPRTEVLLFIAHPLFTGDQLAFFKLLVNGQVIDSGQRRGPRGRLRYLRELFWTIRLCKKARDKDHMFVGGDVLFALVGLWLRHRGNVRAVVLYSVDYVPRRFSNVLINRLYHALDRFVIRHVDVVWNVTREIQEARQIRDGRGSTAPQIVVPVGGNYGSIRRKRSPGSYKPTLVFLGHLLEKQGVQLAIEALPIIKERVPEATLLIIGDGPYRNKLEELSASFDLKSSVKFAGALDDDYEIEEKVASSGIGLALFTPDPDNFSRFADPGKIKTYLACGIPVVLTGVPPIAEQVEREGAGRIVSYSAASVAETIVEYFQHPEMMTRARDSASKLGAHFSWDRIFDEAWGQTGILLKSEPSEQSGRTLPV